MGILDGILLGFTQAATPTALLFCLIGVLLGTLIGVLPGIGPSATIAMLLPITLGLDPLTALIMLAGIYYGAQYGGSITAILVNLPGEPSTAVTAIDGYQMARQGRAGSALAISAIGSFIAGTIATVVLAVASPALSQVALKFGAPEYFALTLLGIVLVVVLSRGSLLKGLAMATFGLLLGQVGTDVFTSDTRFTFGLDELRSGVSFIAVSVGVFGIAEILRNLEQDSTTPRALHKINRLMPTREDFRRSVGPILRGTFLGSLLGVLPGGGAFLSSFASYAVEKRFSRHPEEFGKGAIEGVAGPESANNAGAQTSFIPMLTLGVPSNAVMALMIGAMVVQGIQPGPRVIVTQPELFWGLVASMWIGNAMLVVLNLPLVGAWVSMLRIPYGILFPGILAFSCIGTFSANGSTMELYILAAAGLAGYIFTRIGCDAAPFLLGFVLGPMVEEHFRRAMLISEGNLGVFFERPISAVLMLSVVVLALLTFVPSLLSTRKVVFSNADD
ncbi:MULTISPECIES: tripartite tricarboxylate transporter permease [unclassified Chelatococcus]|uniref:tripartite tricarboxylate transporter permease n=1 Tax=unclassified Chelatococcus TaxID=2638111 RepID=UPI001BCAE828|nr:MULTISPECIES: tripartite tricarboxylate transporter permease [unclassified Chelatococcus]MBS7700311.1 tripartite tricarboxylate transporter permease [Chelatococcus sp. YT9]MBX3556107.1 tripartite tricarboxylate transporter permease [Chelatococcus sp.]